MQICEKHWGMLRAAVEECGMSHLVARSGEHAMQNVAHELQGTAPEVETFDPLMAANMAIMSAALSQLGLYLMAGTHCPVCEAMKFTADWPLVEGGQRAGEAWVEKHWTTGPVEAELHRARELGLMAKVQ